MGGYFKRLISLLDTFFGNERGEIGDGIAEEDELTAEELKALGEGDDSDEDQPDDDGESEDDSKEKEEAGAEDDADDSDDEDGKDNFIPQSAFDERVSEYKAKINLLKTDPEEFYRKYPDERPATAQNENEATQQTTDFDYGAMKVQGGKYDGLTLNEVHQQDPFEATRMYNDYIRETERQAADQAATRERLMEESEREVAEFSESTAQDLFGKQHSELSPEEAKSVEKVLGETLAWMEKTGRGGGIIADAYFLMNRDGITKQAASKGANAVIDQARKGKPIVITSETDGGDLTGFESFESMSADKLSSALDRMSDADSEKFFSEAPESLRKKHPSLPWS